MLEWIESTSVGLWMRESPSVWAFPTVLTLHTAGMAVLVGASWLLDLRLLGLTSRNTPLSAFSWVFPTIAIGLIVNLMTGVLLFIKNATTWGVAIPFFVKMLLVVVSVVLLLPVRKYTLANGGNLEVGGNVRLLAIASILAWAAAVTAGRMLAYLVV